MLKKLRFNLLLVPCYLLLFLLPSPALAATLSLSPSSGNFNRSCSFSLNVNLDTLGVETDGTDAILLFDPTKLSATAINKGSIYSDFPGNNIDNKLGKVSIYALAPADKGYTGKGVLASVNFTVAATASAGLTNINIDFDPKNPTKTTDSNVIKRSTLEDVLSLVTSGSYTLGNGSCANNTTSAEVPTISGGIGGVPETLPASGFVEPTWIAGVLGGLLVATGLFGLRKIVN